MKLHEEMRADGHVKSFGCMRHFQPWGDAANARNIHLNDRTGPFLHILAEMPDGVDRFPNGYRCIG